MKIETTIDLEILLIAASDWKIDSVVRLDKMLFLLYLSGQFDDCFKDDIESEGIPYKYGPFMFCLLDDLQAMHKENFIHWIKSGVRLTSAFRVVASIWKIECKRYLQRALIQMVASLCNSMELEELLTYVYSIKRGG